MGKSKKQPKKNKKSQSNLPKILSIILGLIAIGGIGYIIYDLFQPQINKSIEKNFGIQIPQTSKNVQTNYLSEEDITQDLKDIPTEKTQLVKSDQEEKTEMKESIDKKTNIQKAEKEITKEKTKKPQTQKLFFYTVRNDNLVFSSKEIEIEVDSIYEVFKQLKRLKSTEKELSFVPLKVRLIEYKTNNDTLILNLSKDIENNEYGSTGILYSIYQIAYSLGNYTQSKKVLILIEGSKPKYLGGEGIVFSNPIDITRKPNLNY